MRFKLKSSYIDDKDNLAIYYVVSYPMPNQLLYKKLFFLTTKLQLVENVIYSANF